MSEEKLIRSIHPEVRVLNEAEGLVEYVASDESLDSYQEVIAAKGWRFTRFKKNAPFVDSHNYWSLDKLLGGVESFQVTGGKLIERVRWAKDVEENHLAQLGWKMTLGGFLKAVSVGFFAVRSVSQGSADWGKECASMGLTTEEAAGVRRIFLEQEQIELSACIIGANPNALAKAHQEGCVKDSDLAACGFRDEDMEFVQLAGKAMDDGSTDPMVRELIAREMGRLSQIASGCDNDFRNAGSPAAPAGKRAGAEDEAKRRADRDAFLKRLGSIG